MPSLSRYLHGRYPVISHLAWIALRCLLVGMPLIFTAHVPQSSAGADKKQEERRAEAKISKEWSAMFISIIVGGTQSVDPVMMID